MSKWVYSFGAGSADGRADMKNLLGGKGANLAEMAAIGLPVPSGFTITTEVCTYYTENDHAFPDDLVEQVNAAIKLIEKQMGAPFGDMEDPLLLSVRSGARASMPGMMDSVLDLGLNDKTVRALAKHSGDERFAYDSYRRFIQMYCDVVLGVDHHHFETLLQGHKDEHDLVMDTELTADDWKAVTQLYKDMVNEHLGHPFPQEPHDQLWGAIGAVFESWMNQRAITYRMLHNLPDHWGTAVNVQAMVFGNMGDDCATGVCFTRDPSTGENAFYGEYLINAQGEDVVAGTRTPQELTIKSKQQTGIDLPALEESMPELFKELDGYRHKLEDHYTDMQDMEFTIQKGKLWMLQTRTGKRTSQASLRMAVEMAQDGLIDKEEAVRRIDPAQLDQLLHPTLDPKAPRQVIAHGLPASPGAASGQVVFTAEDAELWVKDGKKVILVRRETSPEDIGGMHVSEGILTARGGMTSHAAVVARGMGIPCVAGAGELGINYKSKTIEIIGQKVIQEGDTLTIDGAKGEIILGKVATVQPELTGDFGVLMDWADSIRTMGVRANAETPKDAAAARKFGAEGIGLCRTEHMFFAPERIIAVREMILAKDEAGRRSALDKILPFQRQDFIDLFTIMQGLPVTIRLLDPPLHEFLPQTESEINAVARAAGVTPDELRTRAAQLHESHPMLGHRGCRLGITYPEIYEIQARAIFEAAIEVSQATSSDPVVPEIMIPLVGSKRELDLMKHAIDSMATKVFADKGTELTYQVGTMIELPRAALQAGQLAESAAFFSFGTNDLTQTALGMSRDDAGSFLGEYVDKGIYPRDPFSSIDQEGVGELIKIAAERGRATRPDINMGICGEHGGDPASIAFCQTVPLSYVSCSPYRVPIARLAAAQAAMGVVGETNA